VQVDVGFLAGFYEGVVGGGSEDKEKEEGKEEINTITTRSKGPSSSVKAREISPFLSLTHTLSLPPLSRNICVQKKRQVTDTAIERRDPRREKIFAGP
jgi:hypothetical protein